MRVSSMNMAMSFSKSGRASALLRDFGLREGEMDVLGETSSATPYQTD
jgi:hypothetical protein